MDLEIVTWLFRKPDYHPLIAKMKTELGPHGVHFVGHGHQHVNHDSLRLGEAFASFKQCYRWMKKWGLKPKAYAYPGSAGREYRTQRAAKRAGFICARGSTTQPEEFYICPGNTPEPDNWYYLPAVVMAQEFPSYINDHEELIPILETALAKSAWVILLYHAIDIPEGWGYYPLEDFTQDLAQIAASDFWSANLDQAAAYIQERNTFELEIVGYKESRQSRAFQLRFRDRRDNAIYDQPLTLDFHFNPELPIRAVHLEPPLGSSMDVPLTDHRLRLNVIPKGQKHWMRLDLSDPDPPIRVDTAMETSLQPGVTPWPGDR